MRWEGAFRVLRRTSQVPFSLQLLQVVGMQYPSSLAKRCIIGPYEPETAHKLDIKVKELSAILFEFPHD
jgi:hypothetical protein